jgi:hypothetical protein
MFASSTEARRYYTRFFAAMGFYIVSLFGAKYLVNHDMASGGIVWLLAVLPGLAITGAIGAVAMRLFEMEDEYLRMLMVRQVLIATGITLTLSTIYGFFQAFDLVGPIELYWVAIVWMIGLSIGAMVNRFTEGTWGACL